MTFGVFSPLGRRSNDFGRGAGGSPSRERRTGLVRRTGARARSLFTGKLIVGDGELSVDCVIRNLSSRGARVVLSRAIDLPAEVCLLILREDLLCEASVSWRNGEQTGLTFTARYDLKRDHDPARSRIRAIWKALGA
jgi:hypothetical protein